MLRLKELRLDRGMSQSEIAGILGITQQAYANYERGAREADYNNLSKLSEIFGVAIDYLLGNTNDINSKAINNKIVVPDTLKSVGIAFYEGDHGDITQEEVDILNDVLTSLRKRTKRGKHSG